MKPWEQPRLIILQRGKPEETILSACKTINGASGSPYVVDWQCDVTVPFCEEECETVANS